MKKGPQHYSRSGRATRKQRKPNHIDRSASASTTHSIPHGTHIVAGRRPLEELLKLAPERIEYAYFGDDLDQRGQELQRAVRLLDVKVETRSGRDLNSLAQLVAHQGVVAIVRDREERDLRDFLKVERSESLVVALDGVEDPHNLGAVMRAAECFGAEAIMWSRNRGCPVTATVAKSSAGASEVLEQLQPANLADALRRFREAEYWCVGAALGERSQPLDNFEWPEKCVLVLGAEGSGLRNLTLELCDFLVQIPMRGRIGSLNVSQAASALLYSWCSRCDSKLVK